jgi:hypothetical protein
MRSIKIGHKIRVALNGDYEDYRFLRCDTVQYGRSLTMFGSNVLPLSSGHKSGKIMYLHSVKSS